jgi:AbrB family looped-hinge helix DNA binding protein
MIMSVSTTHVMKVSRNGQVSIPAGARQRWRTDRVIVVDLGDHVVLRPAVEKPAAALQGKYAGRHVTSEQMRRAERTTERSRERRKG